MKVEGSTGGTAVVGEEPLAARAAVKRRRVVPAKRNGAHAGGRVGRRTRRRVHAESTAIQRLFAACRAVFKGPDTVPAPADVEVLRGMLDKMRPEDVGLSSDLQFFKARDATEGTPTITHTTIYKCENFSMEIFFLPRTAVIPLHNHPGMTVFSKLLRGSMHIKSYDWVDPAVSIAPTPQSRLAKLVVDDVFRAPCDTSVLYPTTGGNMHRFTAITPCAVLDVLGPPYSIEEDRDCTYYTDLPYSHHLNGITGLTGEQRDRLGWLREIDMPEDLKMDCVEYGGPPIFES